MPKSFPNQVLEHRDCWCAAEIFCNYYYCCGGDDCCVDCAQVRCCCWFYNAVNDVGVGVDGAVVVDVDVDVFVVAFDVVVRVRRGWKICSSCCHRIVDVVVI